MTDEQEERIRRAGEAAGRLMTTVDNLAARVARLEAALLAVIGAIVAAWAKSKGLW